MIELFNRSKQTYTGHQHFWNQTLSIELDKKRFNNFGKRRIRTQWEISVFASTINDFRSHPGTIQSILYGPRHASSNPVV